MSAIQNQRQHSGLKHAWSLRPLFDADIGSTCGTNNNRIGAVDLV